MVVKARALDLPQQPLNVARILADQRADRGRGREYDHRHAAPRRARPGGSAGENPAQREMGRQRASLAAPEPEEEGDAVSGVGLGEMGARLGDLRAGKRNRLHRAASCRHSA